METEREERPGNKRKAQGENGMIAEIFVFIVAGLIVLLCYFSGRELE